jgi:outer membrane protein assembly factor BamB
VKYEVRLDGYRTREIVRRGALDDASGLERVELVKLAHWIAKGGGATEAAPACDGSTLVICGRNGVVRRLDARTGAESASFDPHLLDGFAAAAAIRAGLVYAASLDGKGFILSLEKLEPVGTFVTSPVRAAPLAVKSGVAVADEGGTLRLLDEKGGNLWTKKVGRVKCDLAAAPGDRILLVTTEGELQLVDAATGDVVAHRALRHDTTWTAPVVRGDRAFLANEAGEVLCANARTLEVVWTKGIDGPVRGRVAANDLRVVACTVSGAIHVLDADTGNEPSHAESGGKTEDGLVCLADGGFLVVTRTGSVTRFDAKGQVVWRFDAGEPVSAPPRLVDGLIVLVTFKGTAVALAP